MDIRSGERAVGRRGSCLTRVTIGSAQKLVILDQEGLLSLATATRKGLKIHSRQQVTESLSFTPPTLVGNTLYIRDEKQIMALDLGAAGADDGP